MNLDYSSTFKKCYKRLSKKNQDKFDEKILLFIVDEFNEALKNHKLHGQYSECRSINITGDIRAIYRKTSEDDYYFILIGTHSELYS